MGKKHWHRHTPPWWYRDRGEGEDEPAMPPWWNQEHGEGGEGWEPYFRPHPWAEHTWSRGKLHPSDRTLFVRFAAVFGLFVVLGCALLALLGAAAMLFFRTSDLPLPMPKMEGHPLRWWFLVIGGVFLLMLALRRVGTFARRRFTSPLSETMKATEALAEGDLSARVPVQGHGEFRHFSRSFNRMAEALETADRQRRELLADVAHELRTPLTVIQGNVEGLRDGIYEATVEHLDLVLDETQKLSRLVDDLRLLTLAEAGQLPLDFQTLDVPQLLSDVCNAFACQADEAGVALSMEASDSLPSLVADPQRIGQLLGNLVTNALRHTPAGGRVTLGADLLPGSRGIRLWVADTGEGISKEDLPRIFDRFWRGDPARSHEAGAGSGLGLAIAKGLVIAHGGRIWADSQVGQGTMVSCLLPLPIDKD